MTDFLLFFQNLRWQDVLDIGLTSYILFRFYVLFQGTNTFRVLVGIVLLWFFQHVASFLGLIVTSWAIEGVTAMAALIIIIVFRNEIRSVLQAKNLRGIVWGFSSKMDQTPNEVVAESIFELARFKIGALIVIAGKNDYRDFIRNGVSLNGMISKEMIMSIFFPDNPVHDGAVIINGDRIEQVGAILPLTSRQDLPSRYGTRHRASLGMAEKSDAVAVAVSEETGGVTIAKGTGFSRIDSKKQLLKILKKHSGAGIENSSKEKLKLIMAAVTSVLFISGIWYSFSSGMESLISMDVPVEYVNRKNDLEIVDTSFGSVRITLGGSGALIRSIKPEQMKVILDLRNAVSGANTFTITNENITMPPGVILKQLMPQDIDVILDTTIKKRLPVQVDWTKKLADHLILERVALSPDTVEVVGVREILKDISTIYTERIPLDKLTESGEMTVKLALHPASLAVASGSKDRITLSFVIGKRTDTEKLLEE
jgi:uncharacterized protein (TIGR00159 family)